MIELIVFDMAGTTVDEDNVVYKTVRAAVNGVGYSFTQEQVQAVGAGKEKSQAIRDVLDLDGQTHDEDEVQRVFDDFRSRLRQAYEHLEVREQPGASELFKALRRRGIKVILNTGYDRATAESLIAKLKWKIGVDIDGLVTASDVEKGRPSPDMIQQAMKLTRVGANHRVAKIGDSRIDIEEGKNAGCGVTVGITTGAHSRELLEKENPTCVIDRLGELLTQPFMQQTD